MPDVTLGTVTAKTTADNSQFDKTMKESAQKFDATTRANAKSAKLQADAIAFAAKFSSDSVDQSNLRIVAALKVQSAAMADLAKANRLAKAGYGEAGEAADLQAKALGRLSAAKLEVAAATKVEMAAETQMHAVSDRMAASALVRGLETGNVGIRAVENTLIKFGGAGIAQAAFSVIGPIAFAAAVGEGIAKVYELAQQGKNAGQEISRAFSEMNTRMGIGNDELALSNSRLEDMYGKLTKHPTNGLQTALLEAKLAADKLQESLGNDLKALNELLKTHNVSTMEGLLANVSSTGGKGGVNKEIEDVGKEAERQGFLAQKAYADAMKAAAGDNAKQEAATRAYYQRMDDIAAEGARKMRARATDVSKQQAVLDREHATAAKFSPTGSAGAALDLTPVRSAFEGAAETFDKVQVRSQLSGINFLDEKKVGSARQLSGDDSARHKAAEDQMRAMEAQLAALKNDHDVSLDEESRFWFSMEAAAAKYPENLLKIQERTGTLYQEMGRKLEELLKGYEEASRRAAELSKREFEELQAFADKLDEADARRADGMAKLAEAAQHNIDAMSQLTDAQDVATGAISRHDEAMREATRHADEYRAQIKLLKAEQANLTKEDIANGKGADIPVKIAVLQGDADRTQVSDQWKEFQTTTLGGIITALQQFQAAALDASSVLKNVFMGGLDRTNQGILDEITERRHKGSPSIWGPVGHDIFKNAAGASLKAGESQIMKMTGLDKLFGGSAPKGTQGDPMWIRNAMDLAGGAAGLAKNIGSGSVGGILGALTKFIPGFAGGVDDFGGGWAITGEHGPELAYHPPGTSVIPSGRTPSMGPAFNITNHVDARGATDPAAVQAAVARSQMETISHIKANIIPWLRNANGRTVGGILR